MKSKITLIPNFHDKIFIMATKSLIKYEGNVFGFLDFLFEEIYGYEDVPIHLKTKYSRELFLSANIESSMDFQYLTESGEREFSNRGCQLDWFDFFYKHIVCRIAFMPTEYLEKTLDLSLNEDEKNKLNLYVKEYNKKYIINAAG